MKISDTTTRTLTIVLEGREIGQMSEIVRGYLNNYDYDRCQTTAVAQKIMKSLEVD
jgi:hypothetical protein